jgi:hypothetical protein
MAKDTSPFVGRWRIAQMDEWDNDFMDMEAPARLVFESGDMGGFNFGCVHCSINYQLGEREGKPAAEWTFEGSDEGDSVGGRGWAVLEGDGTLRGHLFFHNGDDSGFKAKRR